MTIRMTSLRRAPNGDWFARRMIPEDVREAYRVRAARTVVQWAVTRKRLPSNPFSGATVALPKPQLGFTASIGQSKTTQR
jgi:hypothetical protein